MSVTKVGTSAAESHLVSRTLPVKVSLPVKTYFSSGGPTAYLTKGDAIIQNGVSLIYNAFNATHIDNNLLVWDELPNMYTQEEALLYAEGIIDKVIWLSINLIVNQYVLFKITSSGATPSASGKGKKKKAESGAASSKLLEIKTQTTDPHIVDAYMGAYLALVNFWFGWNHKDQQSEKKTRLNSSHNDPIALLRLGCAIYKSTRNDPTDYESTENVITMTQKQRIQAVLTAVAEIAPRMQKIISTDSSNPLVTPLIASKESKSVVPLLMIFMQKVGHDAVARYVPGVYSQYALARIFIQVVRDSLANKVEDKVLRALGGDTSEFNFTDVFKIFKWVEQNILWAWGGVLENFDKEVTLNMPEGVNPISVDSIFMHTCRIKLTKAKSHDAIIEQAKLYQRQRLNIAWAPDNESMRLWCKEIWPEAFTEANVPPTRLPLPDGGSKLVNTSEFFKSLVADRNSFPAYVVTLMATVHPTFGQVFTTFMSEESETKGRHFRSLLNDASQIFLDEWKRLNESSTFFSCYPHGACHRVLQIKDLAAIKPMLYTTICGTIKSADKDIAVRLFDLATNVFSYEDGLLKLPQSAVKLSERIQYLMHSLQQCTNKVEFDKQRAQLADCEKQIKAAATEKQKAVEEQKAKDALVLTKQRKDCDSEKASMKSAAEVASITTENSELKEQNRKSSVQIAALNAEKDKVEASNTSLQQKLSEAKLSQEALQTQYDSVLREKTEAKRWLTELNVTDQTTLDALLAKISAAEAGISAGKSDSEALTRLQEQLSSQTSTLQRALAAEKKTVREQAQIIEEKDDDIVKVRLSNNEYKTVNSRQKAQLDTEVQKSKDLAAQLASAQTKLTEIESAKTNAIAEKDAEIGRLKAEADKATKSFTELSDKFAAAQKGGSEADAAKQAAFQSILDQKLADQKALFDKALADLNKTHAEEKEKMEKAAKELAEKTAKDMQKLAQDRTYYTDQLEEVNKALEELEKQKTADYTSIADLSKKLDAQAEEISTLKSEASKTVTAAATKTAEEVAAATAATAAATAAAEATAQKTKDLEQAVAAKEAIITQNISTIDELTRKIAGLTAECGPKTATIENLGLQLSALKTDTQKEIDRLNAANQTLMEQVASAEAADATKGAVLTSANAEIVGLQTSLSALQDENVLLRDKVAKQTTELDQLAAGEIAPPPVIAPPAPIPATVGEVHSTSTPTAMLHMVDTPSGTPIKTQQSKVEALALGTACANPATKAEGCVDAPTTNVACDVPDQVMRAICDYSTIEVPIDLRDVTMTYSVLDPGSKVRMQLQQALEKYIVAKDLLLKNSSMMLDRSLTPLKQMYGITEIKWFDLAGMVPCSNVQYARFLDLQSGQACRQVFETLYGSSSSSPSAEKLASIGLTTSGGAAPMFKVVAGPFAQLYRMGVGDVVRPSQLFVNMEYKTRGAASIIYKAFNGGYSVPGLGSAEESKVEEGKRLMVKAILHLTNAAATYLYETAYDEKTIKIPGTSKIPAGAFAMLPRPDINAVLATTVLYPRSSVSSRAPAFAERISKFEKDEAWSLGSRICAAGCEVLDNYSRETALSSGELTFEAKVSPSNLDKVMAEAARRVAEITRLAETLQ